jgi:N-acetylglutamate synthase-like GNAT family acetyltransferase
MKRTASEAGGGRTARKRMPLGDRNGTDHDKSVVAGNGAVNGAMNGMTHPAAVRVPAIPVRFEVRIAKSADTVHVARIQQLLREAKRAGAIIAERSSAYLVDAIKDKRAVVVIHGGELVGFATAHAWDGDKFVSHSAMVVSPEHRGRGLARRMKRELTLLSRKRWPDAAIMSLTLSAAVERMNQSIGFETVPYCDLTKDPEFWKGCEGCIHHAHLKRNQQQDCHCWAGLLVPPGSTRAKVIPRDSHGHPSASSSD